MTQKEKEENKYIEDKYIVPYPDDKIDNITILEGGWGKKRKGKGETPNVVKEVDPSQADSPRLGNKGRAAQALKNKTKREQAQRKQINAMEQRLANQSKAFENTSRAQEAKEAKAKRKEKRRKAKEKKKKKDFDSRKLQLEKLKIGIDPVKIQELSKIEDQSARRKELRMIMEASVSEKYKTDVDINKAIADTLPKSLQRNMPGWKGLDLSQKQKILSHYLRDMNDKGTFNNDLKHIDKQTKHVFDQMIVPKKFDTMMTYAKYQEIKQGAASKLRNQANNILKRANTTDSNQKPIDAKKAHQVQTEAVSTGIEKREVDSSFKKTQNTLSTAIKEKRAELNTQTEKLNKLENEKTNIDTKITKNEAEIKKLEDLNVKEQEFRNKLLQIGPKDTLEKEAFKLSTEIKNDNTDLETLKTELKFINSVNQKNKYDDKINEIKKLENSINEKTENLNTVKTDLTTRRQLESDIKTIETAKENSTIDKLKEENAKLTVESEKKSEEITKTQNVIQRSKNQIKRTGERLNKHISDNPDKGKLFKQEMLNFKKTLVSGDINKIETDITKSKKIKEKKIKELQQEKGNNAQIKLLKKQIRVDNEKINILQQKQTETTKSALTKSLQEQGFSKNEIDKVIASTKGVELKGDTIQEKMSNLTSRINKEITSPEFKININTGKINNLQSKLENTVDKTEQSKIRRQITDLETANKKLEKRKTIMNNSGNSALKRKDKGKLITVIDKKLNSIDKNLQFFKKSINNINKKQPKDLTPGDKVAIERYKQFQQNKSRLELRKTELQTQIRNKTIAKSIQKGVNTTKDFDIFKTTIEGKLDTPEKKKDFQSRFEVFKDALDKGSNSLAKSQAQFIKDQYGIDVKQFKFDNLSKMGEFFKNNVAKYNEKIQKQKEINTEIREVGSLLNKSQKLQKRGKILGTITRSKSQQKKIMNKL